MTDQTPMPLEEDARYNPQGLALGWLWFDYILVTLFIFAGPMYYFPEVAQMGWLNTLGQTLLLTVQLTVHFLVVYFFLGNHFVEPRSATVLSVITTWRIIVFIGLLLCVLGWLQLRGSLIWSPGLP